MIEIKRTRNADSRTADENLNHESLKIATVEHISNVTDGMQFLANKIIDRGCVHDYTKQKYFDEFADNVLARYTGEEFINKEWYQKHISEERHHLNSNCPLDVNLIDVLEMIVDCVMAGKGRSGYVNPQVLKLKDPALLERAYWNTVILVDENVEIKED